MNTDLKGPSDNQFKKFITEKAKIEIVLLNGERILGQVVWKDSFAIHIARNNDKELTIPITSILYFSQINDE